MIKLIRKLLIKVGLTKHKMPEKPELQPHEKAELGQGTWGRQEGKAEPKAYISARVIRADGTIEDLGIISGGK